MFDELFTAMIGSKPIKKTDDAANLNTVIPRIVPTAKGAPQFIFPNGTVLRFELESGQYLPGQSPHIYLQNTELGYNIHINLE